MSPFWKKKTQFNHIKSYVFPHDSRISVCYNKEETALLDFHLQKMLKLVFMLVFQLKWEQTVLFQLIFTGINKKKWIKKLLFCFKLHPLPYQASPLLKLLPSVAVVHGEHHFLPDFVLSARFQELQRIHPADCRPAVSRESMLLSNGCFIMIFQKFFSFLMKDRRRWVHVAVTEFWKMTDGDWRGMANLEKLITH